MESMEEVLGSGGLDSAARGKQFGASLTWRVPLARNSVSLQTQLDDFAGSTISACSG